MNPDFTSYVKARLEDRNVVSNAEKQLISAVDKYDITGAVKLLYIREKTVTLYEAKINSSVNPKRVRITNVGEEISHNLRSVLDDNSSKQKIRNSLFAYDNQNKQWVYDDYFSDYEDLREIIKEIANLFDNLNLKSGDQIIVAENYYNDDNVVNYVLQSLVEKVNYSIGVDSDTSIRGRIEMDSAAISGKVGANFPMNNIMGLMVNKQNIYVPLQECTLRSRFYKQFTWADILGEFAIADNSEAEISGCKCRVVKFSPYVDCYGNIFMSITSVLDSKSRIMLIDGPGVKLSHSTSEYNDEPSCDATPQIVKDTHQDAPEEIESNNYHRNTKENNHIRNSVETDSVTPPAKSKETHKDKKTERNTSDNKIVFDGKTINVGLIDSKIPEMTNRNQLSVYVNIIDGVFKRMARVERIVTDTNVWITEDPINKHEMRHKGMLDMLIKYMKAGKNTFEALPEVYDEIVKLAKSDTAAARKAKSFISTCQEMRLIDFPDLSWDYNGKAYADSKIGDRVVKLYNDGTLFSIITNDTDAKIRWIQALQTLEKESPSDESRPFPPCILCRDLHSLFLLRGKLIKRLNSLKNNK